MTFEKGMVYIAGAGPGDPELISVKVQKLIQTADLILYAGSLVNPEILTQAKAGAVCLNTYGMNMDQQIETMSRASREGKIIARLQTGDPSLYGAVSEQMRELAKQNVPVKIIPGITSAFSAAAELGIEYTLPGGCQSLIFTRAGGKTPVPDAENLKSFAFHHCSMALYLSMGMLDQVVSEIERAGYPEDTPAAVVYRSSWPDEKILRGTLANIVSQVSENGISHQALIIISPALGHQPDVPSYLYGGYQEKSRNGRRAIISVSAAGSETGALIQRQLPESDLFIPQKFAAKENLGKKGFFSYSSGVRQILQECFHAYDALICIMASGIAVRELAPCLQSKKTDPAVIVMDPQGKNIISLLSGHLGGANQLANEIALITKGNAVITTASDSEGIPALDILIRERGWVMPDGKNLTRVMGALVNYEKTVFLTEMNIASNSVIRSFPWEILPENSMNIPADCSCVVSVTNRETLYEPAEKSCSLTIHSKNLVLGIGCNRNTPAEEIQLFAENALKSNGLNPGSVCGIATIPEKADEPGIRALAEKIGCPLIIVSHDQVLQAGNVPHPSSAVQELFGIPGVAEPCALAAAGKGAKLILEKVKSNSVTLAAAVKEIE